MKIIKFIEFMKKRKITESIKDEYLDEILDKISKKTTLSKREENFLKNFKNEEDLEIYTMLSNDSTFEKINQIIDRGKKIICNLNDKYGKIGEEIKDIDRDISTENYIITLHNGTKIKLLDNFLYNIIYDIEDETYSLEPEDEFYEKLPIIKK